MSINLVKGSIRWIRVECISRDSFSIWSSGFSRAKQNVLNDDSAWDYREKETPSVSQGSVKSYDHPLTATLKLYR